MTDYKFTKQAKALYDALKEKGINVEKEFDDGHKRIDIACESAKIYIEIDGLPHYTDPKKIETDFERDHWSDKNDDFDTIRIPNIIIDQHLEEVTEAVARVILDRLDKNLEEK